MIDLYYKIYDKKSLIVYGDKEKYQTYIKTLDGNWGTKLKNSVHPGWIVPKEKERELKELIKSIKFNNLSSNVKSRKSQKKYHRAVSEDSSDSSEAEEDIDPVILKMLESEREKNRKK